MVGNNTGLMELANHFGLERFVDGEFYRGGKRLLPNIVEAIVGYNCILFINVLYNEEIKYLFLTKSSYSILFRIPQGNAATQWLRIC